MAIVYSPLVVGSPTSMPSLDTTLDLPHGTSTLATAHVAGGGSTEASTSLTTELRLIDNKEMLTSSSYLPHRRGHTGAASPLMAPPVPSGTGNRCASISARVATFAANVAAPRRALSPSSDENEEMGTSTLSSTLDWKPSTSTSTTSSVGVGE